IEKNTDSVLIDDVHALIKAWRASSRGHHKRQLTASQFTQQPRLDQPEMIFTVLAEDFRYGLSFRLLNFCIQIDKIDFKMPGKLLAQSGFSRSGHTDEEEFHGCEVLRLC